MTQSEGATPQYDFSIAGLRLDLQKRHARSSGTPVRTRGRRQANPSPASAPKPSHHRPTSDPTRSPHRSRATTQFAPRLKDNTRPGKKVRQPSRLEQLPLELIEEIFLQCLNINLLRAAPQLGRLLSNEHIYTQFAYRIYCTNISRDRADSPSLSPPADMKNASNRERIMKDQEAMRRTRSLGLTCQWATYTFFRRLHTQVRKTPDLWLGLFSCSIPSKLLRPPLNPQGRRLLLALASSGAKLDVNTLAREEVEALWRWAAARKDTCMLQCLMEPRFGFGPSRDQRVAALQESGFAKEVIQTFRDTRASDAKNTRGWPDDWNKEWPLGDPYVEAELCLRHGVEFTKLEDLMYCTSHPNDWKVGFGGEIPGPHKLHHEDYDRNA